MGTGPNLADRSLRLVALDIPENLKSLERYTAVLARPYNKIPGLYKYIVRYPGVHLSTLPGQYDTKFSSNLQL